MDVMFERVVQRTELDTVATDRIVAGFSSSMIQSVKSMVPGALLHIWKNHCLTLRQGRVDIPHQ